ncbi:MAG: hypothetical protein K2M44_05265 [Clostridia bacterium]|nr:hypothetical protein [Clostridia bacterium]
MRLDKFHKRLDNAADMDSEKLNRHINAHLDAVDGREVSYDVSVDRASKTAVARRFRPAYLSAIAIIVVVVLAITLPLTLIDRGGDPALPSTPTLPEGPNDFYCDSSQYQFIRLNAIDLADYVDNLGWSATLPKFDTLEFISETKNAYVAKEGDEVYGIYEKGGIILEDDYRILEYTIVPKNITIDVLKSYSDLCVEKLIENDIEIHYSVLDYMNNEFVYFQLGDYNYYMHMEGSAYAGELISYLQLLLR